MSERRFTLPAFAKINLSLAVLGRREDGFHELRTVFQTVSLHDRLTFEAHTGDRLELTCSDPLIPTDHTNLVLRAAEALREQYGVRHGLRVHLEKRIPSRAGLGGGSSDAAVALMALSWLWETGASGVELAATGARLGADVPFFLTGGTALGSGTGTEIIPLEDAPKKHLVIVKPEAEVSTAEAFESLNAPALTKANSTANLLVSRADVKIAASHYEDMHNDFEGVIFERHPEIEGARNRLIEVGARGALLTGSGSSVFGVFDNREGAERAGDELRHEPRWRVFACESLSRDAYRQSFGVLYASGR